MRKLSIIASLAALTALLSGAAFSWNYWRFPRFWQQPEPRNPMPGDGRDAGPGEPSHTYGHVSNVERHAEADDEAAGGGWILLGILGLIAAVVILVLVV